MIYEQNFLRVGTMKFDEYRGGKIFTLRDIDLCCDLNLPLPVSFERISHCQHNSIVASIVVLLHSLLKEMFILVQFLSILITE